MTALVLPYGPSGNSPVYSGGARNATMPCVFDGEALDFESALMTDWNSDINVYETSADDFSARTPSDGNMDLKRKLSATGSDAHLQQHNSTQPVKKPRTISDEEDLLSSSSPLQSSLVSSSSSSSSSSCSSSSSSSSSSGQEDEDASSTADDEDYIPMRRRGPQMWNSRQRWKDERKRVLKLSLGKLAEIEDPELCMHRSVVINNTVRRLHADIREERQAKLRQRQQRMDLFNERFHQGFHHPHPHEDTSSDRQDKINKLDASSSFDDSSCDEMFGISEDFLRVTIPDRRVPTPLPTATNNDSSMDTSEVTTSPSCYNTNTTTNVTTTATTTTTTSCDSASNNSSFNAAVCRTTATGASNNSNTTNNNSSSSNRRMVQQQQSNSSGTQCATQYRTTSRDATEHSFPPRVPILDSVVYHSLLASLESS